MKKRRRKKAISFKDWFEMSAGEQRGVLVLLALIVMLIGCNFLVPFFIHPANQRSFEIINLTYKPTPKTTPTEETTSAYSSVEKSSELFPFNPNTLDDAGWRRLGFHDGQIKSIRNYVSRGGKFRTVQDLSKMYVISSEMYKKIEPYVDLPQEENRPFPKHDTSQFRSGYFDNKFKSEKDENLIVELNLVDTTQLKKLRGVGSYLARKIVEYRDRLGGFRNFEQLAEIYRVTPGKADTLKQKMTLDLTLISRMNLNEVNLERLKKFPYLTPSQAQALLAYREKHGNFRNTSEMKKCVLIDQVTFEKVKDYFEVIP